MIKLENNTGSLMVTASLRIQSPGNQPMIVLTTDQAWKQVGGQPVVDVTMLKQEILFFTEEGPVKLTGKVPEDAAISIPAAFAVVVEVEMTAKDLPAYQVGRKGGSLVALGVLRILEVWTTPDKCLWKRKETPARAA